MADRPDTDAIRLRWHLTAGRPGGAWRGHRIAVDLAALCSEVDRLGMELEEHADLLAEARREVDRLTAENQRLMEGARP